MSVILLTAMAFPRYVIVCSFAAGMAAMRMAILGEVGAYLATAILFQICSFFGLIVLLCLAYFGISLLIRCGKRYLKWNRKIWTKGF